MKLPISGENFARLTRARLHSLVHPSMYGYRTMKDATAGLAISHHATCGTAAEPSADMVNRAQAEIIRRYRNAGYSLEDAQEQAAIFGRRFVVVGDHAPEPANEPKPDPALDATLDRIAAVIG
jgi:hypothetical protein